MRLCDLDHRLQGQALTTLGKLAQTAGPGDLAEVLWQVLACAPEPARVLAHLEGCLHRQGKNPDRLAFSDCDLAGVREP